ncbi:chromo domain-containing protein [Trichonephila clavipes]|nr:chromo domain-containing protein [Trichonephila clavipes]
MEKFDRLRKLYFNRKEPLSFGGVKLLSKASGVHLNDFQKWLSQQDVYALHKPVRYKFQRRKTIAYGINELWQSDLLDMQKPARYNKIHNSVLRQETYSDSRKLAKPFAKAIYPVGLKKHFAFTKEKERYPTIPPTYTLQDFNSIEIEGRFYNEELQKIDKSTSDYWAIEKIIRTKCKGASRQLFVKWVGFPDSQNSWIRADQNISHNESEHE